MILAALIPAALAEHLVFEVRYLGLPVGTAEARIDDSPSGERTIVAEAHSADWYRPIYALDDTIVSTSQIGGGSRRYTATYREGDFAQDVDMRLDGPDFAVSRRQRTDAGWRAWSDTYDRAGASEPVHDGLSALLALRGLPLEPGAQHAVSVFTGKEVVVMRAEVGERQTCTLQDAPVRCVPVQLTVGYGDEKRELRVALSDDAARLPIAATVWASGVKVEVTLVRWSDDG